MLGFRRFSPQGYENEIKFCPSVSVAPIYAVFDN